MFLLLVVVVVVAAAAAAAAASSSTELSAAKQYGFHECCIMAVCQGCNVHGWTNELVQRANVKTLTLSSNRCVTIDLEHFNVTFPYDYNFADCLDEASFAARFQSLISIN